MKEYPLVPLGTLISQAKTVRCGEVEYPVLSMTMHNGLVFQDEKFKKVIASKDRSNYKVVYRNQLVISFPIDEGVLAAQRITDAGIVSPAYGIWDINQEKVLPEFLEYALRCERALNYYKSKLRGSTARRRSLPTPTLLAFTVPLPPLDEQVHLLAIMHKLKHVIDKREKEINDLDELVKARFVEMFGDFRPNYTKWDIVSLDSVCTKISDGEHGSVPRVDKGHLYLNAKNIKIDGSIDWQNTTYISSEDHERIYKRCNPEMNDILLTTTGTIGNVAIVPAVEPFSLDRGITLLKLNDKKICSAFLMCLLKSKYLQQCMKKSVHASAIGHLFLNQVKILPVLLPSLELQNQFSDFVRYIDKSKIAIDSCIIIIEKALQSRYHYVWGICHDQF